MRLGPSFSRRAVLLPAAGGVHGQVPAVPAAGLRGARGGSCLCFAGGPVSCLSSASASGGVHLGVGRASSGAGACGVPRWKAPGSRVEKCQEPSLL